ncbi:ABC transporter permease [Actinomadura macra]|uniref:ABC transporter permease n=1 Tax=Actinomadura macra TaxID=46164 RepID=UPI0008322BC1|nr:ABC transporter permease subunit [Actinomadura macra]
MNGTVPLRGRVPRVSVESGRPAGVQVARLTVRLIRRGALWLALVVGFYMAVEVFSYEQTYPDAAARLRLAKLGDDPAMRMLQGIPHAVETPGGFVVWDAGWMLAAIIGIWALLVTGRLLRGEEESGRAELVLAAPVSPARVVLVQAAVVTAAAVLTGAAAAAVLTAMGTGVVGSVLFGLALSGVAATFAGVAAIASQLFQIRRRATGISAAVFGILFLLRMGANSADSRGWLRWLSPFGWLDELHPYREPRWGVLAVSLIAPAALFAIAVRLRGARDTGGALITGNDRARARYRLLGGPTAFAWRGGEGMLAGWLLGIAAYAFMSGALVATVTDFVADDPDYRKVLESMGWDAADAAEGFAGLMGVLIGLLIALYSCWRIGAARAEEATGRLDHVLTRPVTRSRWLSGHVLLTFATSVLLALASALAMWAGAAVTGADLGLADSLAANLNPLPVVLLAAGLAVLLLGARPRLTVTGSVAATSTAYLVEMIGPALNWPDPVLGLSPFHHLAKVPAEPFRPLAAVTMTALAVLLAVAGGVLFDRRDLTGD